MPTGMVFITPQEAHINTFDQLDAKFIIESNILPITFDELQSDQLNQDAK